MPGRVKAPRGVTLVELVIAVTVLSIGTLAGFRAFDQAQRGIGGQEARIFAHQVAMNRAAELRLTGMVAGRALPGQVRMGPFDWTVTIVEDQTRVGLIAAEIRVTAPDQPGARLAVFVPALVTVSP